ncbi:MAG: cyclic beta 1-2 glucan synthetase [Litorilinea sp.]|nr:MAG: cyclic beta 1-2 glucan synthetase [Litorilinea sp.]
MSAAQAPTQQSENPSQAAPSTAGPADQEAPAEGGAPQSLEDVARQVAEAQAAPRRGPGRRGWLRERLDGCEELLTQAHSHFASQAGDERWQRSRVAEWLLDNYYVVRQTIRQIQEDMPARYYAQLPKLSTPGETDVPRVYNLAVELARACELHLEPERIVRFLRAYQETTPLTIGEVWAIPVMLRLSMVEALAGVVARAAGLAQKPQEAAIHAWSDSLALRDEEAVARTILSLRTLAAQDWKEFFEEVNRAEQVLRSDPAGVYGQMDFDTRDTYRKEVEKLALAIGRPEEEVAQAAVALAQSQMGDGQQDPGRLAHVGYYLVDAGRPLLEQHLGYRPSWWRRMGRWLRAHPTPVYLTPIALLTALLVLLFVAYAWRQGGSWLQLVAVALLTLVPATTVAVNLVNGVVTRVVPPSRLPKMDFDEGIPAEYTTLVTVPALLTDQEEVTELLRQLEQHYLANGDPNLHFALLTDFADADQEELPGDAALLAQVQAGIEELNARYRRETPGPFYLFHRRRTWNPQEGVWMGWERKRGKLGELNLMILGREPFSPYTFVGDRSILSKVKYVITLDADTILWRGSARRLVATLAHPLNRATFDPESGEVVAGYTILQPRVQLSPMVVNRSRFVRIFGGDSGFDLYTLAVSDVYQDLFGEGIYVGKGIYDVAAFERSLQGRRLENSLLSHDLFEGINGRAGLVTDVVLFEDYPPNYLAYMARLHRWVRGDWQLLPWLMPKVPLSDGRKVPNYFSLIDRWKIVDNLRRSLFAPTLLALLVAGWFWLPGSAWLWTLAAVLAPGVPTLVNILDTVTWNGLRRVVVDSGARWLLSLIFLAHEALVTLHAIGITLVRLTITRRHLLQWTTSAHMARILGSNTGPLRHWLRMANSPLLVVAIVLLGGLTHFAWLAAAPFLLAWLVAPQVAYWLDQPLVQQQESLAPQELQELRKLARRTWLYFEQFVGPEDHWLAPDHFQESPRGLVAHRTSPTNIGLALLSTLAAYDFGYVGILDLVARLQNTFATLDRLERYRGHLLNWYDTRSLTPLPPRYVSTVDSGNLAGCLIALREGCLEVMNARVMDWKRWQGLLDTLTVIHDEVARLASVAPAQVEAIQQWMDEARAEVHGVEDDLDGQVALVARFTQTYRTELDRRVLALLEADLEEVDPALLHRLRTWIDRLHAQLSIMQRELDALTPWSRLLPQAPDALRLAAGELGSRWQALQEALPLCPRLNQIPALCDEAAAALESLRSHLAQGEDAPADAEAIRAWCQELDEALDTARRNAQMFLEQYREVVDAAEEWLRRMDFAFLYDPRRRVFRIGFNVDTGRPDANYYDLLASEARIASLVAIAKGDVPQRHWLHLARPFTRIDGGEVLLSWSGTMFEYLMPMLLMEHPANTLLGQSCMRVVDYQIAYGQKNNIPWGISESGFYQFDNAMNYQYRAFGVPGLGFKRGLGEDLVVAPYASLLALPIRPKAVVENLQHLNELGMLGTYGYYEAIDFTPARMPLGQKHALVRSFMVHHQGMIFLSLANYLRDQATVRRFHRDLRIQSVALLLHEQIPHEVPVEELAEEEAMAALAVEAPVTIAPWSAPPRHPFPLVHYLSNGRFGTLITGAGGGFSRWQGRDLTRWRADTTRDHWGVWVYLRDQESGELWSVAAQPVATAGGHLETHFYPHMADIRHTYQEVAASLEITVPPEQDVEVRRIRLTNQSDRPRRLLLCSYGEVVLADQNTDRRHPAFNKLFISSEYHPDLNALLFQRRPRSADERPIFLAHALVLSPGQEATGWYETDRASFLGRDGSPRRPAALTRGELGAPGKVGNVLDPVMAIAQEIELGPHDSVEVAYITAAAESRRAALDLVSYYHAWSRVQRAFDLARGQSEQEMRYLELQVGDLERFQKLLSLLVYPHAALRAEPAVLAANSQGQARLWPYTISGDYPILLVRVHDESSLPLVRELLRAHTYWRNRGLQIDLVIMNEKEAGYIQDLHDQLHRLLAQTDNDAWLNRRGGIFLVNAQQMPEADRVLLASAARVLLDASRGSLEEQLAEMRLPGPPLPALVPTRRHDEPAEETPPLPRPGDLQFDNGWGGFSADGREYVIYLPSGHWTPAPWINVIANPELGFLVSEGGGGYSWAENSGENRLTPWSNDPVLDEPGEALYLRDEETAAVWSPTPRPAGDDAPYLIRHGAGYTIFCHHSHGLKQELRLFAAPDAPVKIAQLRLENTWQRVRRITATYYAEWVLGVHRADTQQYVIPEYDAERHALLAHNPYNAEFGRRMAFLAASKEPHGLTGDRAEFLGRLGDLERPAALSRIGLAGTLEAGRDPCAAIQLHMDLQPGEVEEIYFILGQGQDRDEALALVDRFQQPDAVAAAWEKATEFWDQLLGTVQVQTPDPAMDLLLNRWLLYQDLACRIWGRSAFYQSSGAYGFRDQLQDVMAVLHAAPHVAREHILRAARHQFEEGDVLHWWHPPSGRGVRTRIADNLLWLPFVTAHYVRVTGDRSILAEKVPFRHGEPLDANEEERYDHYPLTEESYTLYEHCCRAIARGATSGPHGLPLIGAGDWNDGFNRVGIHGRGESVWLGWFLYATLMQFAEIAEQMGDDGRAGEFRQRAIRLQQALEEHAWDGAWYRRAYYDDGSPLGSRQNRECQIDAIAQSWAVLSEGGDPQRARQAMEAVAERLVREEDRLILLFTPPLDKTPRDPGYIKGYPPGVRENGGQYTHAATWTVWAYVAQGDGDRAGRLYRLLNPVYHSDRPEKAAHYRVEPYVVAADVYGEPPHTGRGGWTWYTGSGGWMYRLGLEGILGVQRRGDLLRIDPCIPRDWPGFQLRYRVGRTCYHIQVENPDGVNRGVASVLVDGEPAADGAIPLVDDGQEHHVQVRMGTPGPHGDAERRMTGN